MSGPDRGNLERWAAALAAVADRVRQERGVDDPWSLSGEDDVLWANYGDLRVRLGADAHVRDEAELFDEVDGWVAFDRRRGPGAVLDRDREAEAAWRAQLPALHAFWQPVAARVLADVAATTGVDVSWSIEVAEWELDLPPTPGLRLTFGTQDPPVRRATFPALQLRLPHQRFDLPVLDDVEDAVAHLAGVVQDHVVEELPGAWPVCAGHVHPMQPDLMDDAAVWRCPVDPIQTRRIGHLTDEG